MNIKFRTLHIESKKVIYERVETYQWSRWNFKYMFLVWFWEKKCSSYNPLKNLKGQNVYFSIFLIKILIWIFMAVYQFVLDFFLPSCIKLNKFSIYPLQETDKVPDSEGHLRWLNTRKVRSFYSVICENTFRVGAKSLMQVQTCSVAAHLTCMIIMPGADQQYCMWQQELPRIFLPFDIKYCTLLTTW